MQIYIMRHGQASMQARTDAERPLTRVGKQEVDRIGAYLAKHAQIDEVWVSPYLRAQQSWQQLQGHLSKPQQLATMDFITPDGHAEEVADIIHGCVIEGKSQSLLLVSHLPLVSYLVAMLAPSAGPVMFPTAGLACIDYQPSRMAGELLWFVDPSQC